MQTQQLITGTEAPIYREERPQTFMVNFNPEVTLRWLAGSNAMNALVSLSVARWYVKSTANHLSKGFLKDTPLTWTFSINIYERNPSICSLPSLTLHSGAAPRLLVGAWTSHEFIAGPTQCNKQPPSLLKPLNTICVFSCNEFVFICILFN